MRITISGLSGCGNSTVAQGVGRALGLEVVNYTFHDIARERGISFEELLKQAEASERVDLELDKKLVELASKDNVVLGSRLACWLVDADLKVWLYASPKVRVKRVAQREGKDVKQVSEETRTRDKEDLARYKRLYGVNLKRHEDVCDLIINTENLLPEQITAIIVEAAKQKVEAGAKKKKPSRWPKKVAKIIEEKLKS